VLVPDPETCGEKAKVRAAINRFQTHQFSRLGSTVLLTPLSMHLNSSQSHTHVTFLADTKDPFTRRSTISCASMNNLHFRLSTSATSTPNEHIFEAGLSNDDGRAKRWQTLKRSCGLSNLLSIATVLNRWWNVTIENMRMSPGKAGLIFGLFHQ